MILTADERQWRAQDDAYTLAKAAEIKADDARMEAAKAQAGEMAKQAESRVRDAKANAKAMRKLAGRKPGPGRRSGAKRRKNAPNLPLSASQAYNPAEDYLKKPIKR